MDDQKIVSSHDVDRFTVKKITPAGLRGFLEKRGHLMKNWRKRYFVLSAAGELKYYVDETCSQLQGAYVIRLDSVVSTIDEFAGRQHILSLEAEKLDSKKLETLHVSAESTEDRQIWLGALNEVIHGGNQVVNVPYLWNITFYPSLTIRVTFGNPSPSTPSATPATVDDGNTLSSSQTHHRPSVQFIESANDITAHYAVLMVHLEDEAASRTSDKQQPPLRVHWAAVNMTHTSTGSEVLSYSPPSTGVRGRYFVLVFRQTAVIAPGQLEKSAAGVSRHCDDFSAVEWARGLGLGSSPAGIDWFRVARTEEKTEDKDPQHEQVSTAAVINDDNAAVQLVAGNSDGSEMATVDKNALQGGVSAAAPIEAESANCDRPLSISVPVAGDIRDSGSSDSGVISNNNSSNESDSSSKPRSPAKSVGFRSDGADGNDKDTGVPHSPVSTLTSGNSSGHSLIGGDSSGSSSPQRLNGSMSISFDSPPPPTRSGAASSTSSSFMIKSALKKSSVFGPSPTPSEGLPHYSSSSSMSSSPAGGGRKKLGVSFMIVNPRLQSDTARVNASFYEGIHLPPPNEEDEEEEDGAGYDDLPDYQVSVSSSSNRDNGGPGIMRGSSKDNAEASTTAVSAGISKPQSATAAPAPPLTSSINSATPSEVVNSSAPPVAAPQRTSSINNGNGSSISSVEGQPSANGAPPAPLRRGASLENGVSGSRTSLVPLMERVSLARTPQEYCAVFGINTTDVFEGELMRKKFSRDLVMKESFVWVEPASKSIHWAKSSTQKTIRHKHILLDKHSTYHVLSADAVPTPASSSADSVTPSSSGATKTSAAAAVVDAKLQSYKRTAGGAYSGTIKGAELEDLTITITTDSDQRLKIKIPPGNGGGRATQRAKDWFRVIKLLTQDTAN